MTRAGRVHAPVHLEPSHDLSDFVCGDAALDEWLRRRARANEANSASRTYVACRGRRVVGYYALATGAVARAAATSRIRRNAPEPIPVMIIGRLAVDRRHWDCGLGSALLRDAVLRILQATEIAGIRAILVHATSDDAKRFYEANGFHASALDPMTLMIGTREAARALPDRTGSR